MTNDLDGAVASPPSGAVNEPGEGGPPAPAASEPANDPGVPLPPDTEAGPVGAPDENAIPHWRVKEMVGRAEARVRAEYEARIAEYEKRLAASGPSGSEPESNEGSRIRGVTEGRAAPRPALEAARLRAYYAREAQIAIRQREFHETWNTIRTEHGAILGMPGAPATLKEAALSAWRTGADPLAAARSAGRAFYHQAAQAQRARQALRASAPKVTGGGGGGGAVGRGRSGSISDRITSRLAGLSGGGYY